MTDRFEEILKRKNSDKLKVIEGSFGKSCHDQYFAIVPDDKQEEYLLEVRTRDGFCSAFQFFSITWLVYEPDIGIIVDFNGYTVSIEGKGLKGALYDAIKRRRVSWIKESDDPSADAGKDIYVSKITISPPNWAEEGGA